MAARYFKLMSLDLEKKHDTYYCAMNFLQSKKNRFECSHGCPETTIKLDKISNAVILCDPLKVSLVNSKTSPIDLELLKKLADAVENYADAFAELDDMIRNVPLKSVKRYDIKIIADQLRRMSDDPLSKVYPEPHFYVEMSDNSPLCTLALAVWRWKENKKAVIKATPGVAAVCTLFADLCSSVGLPVEVCYINEQVGDVGAGSVGAGSVAAVTEYSDIDSAVDIIFSSDTNIFHPWRLRRVFVQECVASQFKDSLRSKCSQVKQETEHVSEILSKAAERFVYNKLLILYDFAGDAAELGHSVHTVLVENYRTTHELLSLLKTYEPQYLSLWCTHTSTADEVMFNVNAHNIWLNNFGELRSCYGVAETFLDPRSLINAQSYSSSTVIKHVDKLWKTWNNVALEDRKKTLLIAIAKYQALVTPEKCSNFSKVLGAASKQLRYVSPTTVTVHKGCVTYCCSLPVGLVSVNFDLEADIIELLRSVVFGNGLVLKGELMLNAEVLEFTKICSRLNVPIVCGTCGADDDQGIALASELYKTKTIWSQYGETFAN